MVLKRKLEKRESLRFLLKRKPLHLQKFKSIIRYNKINKIVLAHLLNQL